MDFDRLPPEITEQILIELEVQDLASCALADDNLEKIIYSRQFLDQYCRSLFGSSWITVGDITDLDISFSFEFWFWVYETIQIQDNNHGPIIVQGNHLTKIGAVKHLFYMWLMFGHRSNFIDSHTSMNNLYPLPKSIKDIYGSDSKLPEPFVISTLAKIFMWLPELVMISYNKTEIFSMQNGPIVSSQIQHIYNTRLESRLPNDFLPLFSVEMMFPRKTGFYQWRTPVIIILFTKSNWVLWIGMPDGRYNGAINSFDYMYFGTLTYDLNRLELTNELGIVLKNFNSYLSEEKLDGFHLEAPFSCPIISFQNSEVSGRTVGLALDKFRALQGCFGEFLKTVVNDLVGSSFQECNGDNNQEKIFEFLCPEPGNNNAKIDEYAYKLFKGDERKGCFKISLSKKIAVCRCILQHIAYLFRNDIQKALGSNFSHAFLCKCLGKPFPLRPKSVMKIKIEKCLANSLKDGLYSPTMWPPHVLSAAILVIPALVDVIQSDIALLVNCRIKYAISTSAIHKLKERLKLNGLTLKSRPPGKPRYPPMIKQLRILTIELSE